jgi:uncharacterized membrane protein
MWGVILITLATQGFALRAYIRRNTPEAERLFFLGGLFYGASIILIAQIYHLGEHMPDGVFYWALGVLPLALLLKSPWIMLQSLLLALAWFFMERGMGFDTTVFPLFVAAAIAVLYMGRKSQLLFFTTVFAFAVLLIDSLIRLWYDDFINQFGSGNNGIDIVLCFAVLTISAYALSRWLMQCSQYRDYGAKLSGLLTEFALFWLVVFSYELPWRELSNEYLFDMLLEARVLMVCAGLSALSLFAAYKAGEMRLTAAANTFFYLALIATGSLYIEPMYLQVADNLLLIVAGLILVKQGVDHLNPRYFYFGAMLIMIVAWLRYFDLVEDYISSAILFMVFAGILIAMGRYWKNKVMKTEVDNA